MIFWKKIVAVFCLSLVSVQTLSISLSFKDDSFQSSNQKSGTYFKIVSFSEALFTDSGQKRISPELTEFASSFLSFHRATIEDSFLTLDLNECLIGQFHLYKSIILSSVNLIFPFQYFW